MAKKENIKKEVDQIEVIVENDEQEIVDQNEGNFFTRWFRKTTEGREKNAIYIMFSIMLILTIFILIERFSTNQKEVKFDMDTLYEQNDFNGVNNAIEDYQSMEDTKSLLKEYEALIKQDTLDTLRIKTIEKTLNEKLLNNKQ